MRLRLNEEMAGIALAAMAQARDEERQLSSEGAAQSNIIGQASASVQQSEEGTVGAEG